KVVNEDSDEGNAALRAIRFPGLRDAPKSSQRRGAGLLARHAAPHVVFHCELEVRFEFMLQVFIEGAAAQEPSAAAEQFTKPIHGGRTLLLILNIWPHR